MQLQLLQLINFFIVSCCYKSLPCAHRVVSRPLFSNNPKSSERSLQPLKHVTTTTAIFFVAISSFISPIPVIAKTELPSLDKCFNAVRKELNGGDSLARISKDIENKDWEDLKAFTREYDAGFRGGVLKSAWKQMEEPRKTSAIEITNSFTFDLIALNKAARSQDVNDAIHRLEQVTDDLKNFAALDK